ncbi:DUF5133 domain-containing protein [Streptomyces sp. NPDC089424]|uniref:DUF5133 domain-containing protein n=1 Tax=Streptomyces sp. NPDC089424 TaxID=3365917 RepID=UPI00381B186A
MLNAHPAVLKDLVEQYEALRTLHGEDGSEEVRRRMDDIGYTLCVSTATRDVDEALVAARRQLSALRASDDTLQAT